MRIHKTKYSNLTDKEIVNLADQQGFNISDIGLELMERLSEDTDTVKKLQDENDALEDEISNLEDEINSLKE